MTSSLILIVTCCTTFVAQEGSYIRLNQIGFEPDELKIAIAFSSGQLTDEYEIKDAASEATVFKAKVIPVTGSWGQFTRHSELNFSKFQREGRFFIQVGNVRSSVFIIRRNVSAELPDQLLEFMRQQRCGYNPFVDAVCHSFDGRTAYGPMPAGSYLDASGGWHDAGDQLKYLLTSSNATAQLLLAYQIASTNQKGTVVLADKANGFGQPGRNGVADLLDEARWGLEWMLKLHPAPEQLYHQVADDRDHKGFRLPQNETVDYGWGPVVIVLFTLPTVVRKV